MGDLYWTCGDYSNLRDYIVPIGVGGGGGLGAIGLVDLKLLRKRGAHQNARKLTLLDFSLRLFGSLFPIVTLNCSCFPGLQSSSV